MLIHRSHKQIDRLADSDEEEEPPGYLGTLSVSARQGLEQKQADTETHRFRGTQTHLRHLQILC